MTDELSDDEIASAVSELTEEDLRQRSEALHEAQETWEKVAYIATPKMPCPECGGAGAVSSGSLGDVCVGCGGARVVDSPGADRPQMPPFASMRAAITAYGNALADRLLPDGHRAKKGLALPPAATLPSLDELKDLQTTGINAARQLRGAPAIDPRQLPAPKPAKGLAGEGDLGEYEDAELDEMDDQAHGRRR